MAKADVLQLVTDLADGMENTTTVSEFYDDIVFSLGLKPNESLVNATPVLAVKSQAQYDYPATAIRLLAVLYGNVHLTVSDTSEAQAYDKQWRTTRGQPLVWLVEQETRRIFTVAPVPQISPTGVGVDFTSYTDDNFTVIHTENRTDVHEWEELYVAFRVLVMEFERDSDHTDHVFAGACRELATAMGGLLGLQ